ncbi:MAG: DUF1822 family protein [Cyanobacteria bacterium J06641_5]
MMHEKQQVAIAESCEQDGAAEACAGAPPEPAVDPTPAEEANRKVGSVDEIVPISYRPAESTLEFARKLADEQLTVRRQRLVYLNTLAVTTVGYHINRLGFSVDYTLSDSCGTDSYSRRLFNVADLLLPDIGTLECRPVLPDQGLAVLPPQEAFDRVAVVLVEIDEAEQMLKILGFALPGRKYQQLPLLVPRRRLYSPRRLGTFLKQRQEQESLAPVC